MQLKANFQHKQKKFMIPGFITANKTKEQVFENFLSPFGNHGNYVKVLFKIKIDMANDSKMRTTFINLCQKGKSSLTLDVQDEKILFALPQFAIEEYSEFKEDWFAELSHKQKDEYEALWVTKEKNAEGREMEKKLDFSNAEEIEENKQKIIMFKK